MSAPPENAKGATQRSRARCKTLAREFDDAGNVKASGREESAAAQAGRRRTAQWFTHALCLTELAASNPRALEMLRVHLEAMREDLRHE